MLSSKPSSTATTTKANNHDDGNPLIRKTKMRIACLIPSATDICVLLGLQHCIVGVTHECDTDVEFANDCQILTSDGVNSLVSSQRDIHDMVAENSRKAVEVLQEAEICKIKAKVEDIPSLYPVDNEGLKKSRPTLIITQDLCKVCAPSPTSIQKILLEDGNSRDGKQRTTELLALTPHTLNDTLDNIVQVAVALNMKNHGIKVRNNLRSMLIKLKTTIKESSAEKIPPSMFLLEWLDPPFDAGHWIPDMMEYAVVKPSVVKNKMGRKSKIITWEEINETDPDVILVACCGFDLQRNINDAVKAKENLKPLRACIENRLFATNGDQYFARPGPKLLTGSIIMALVAYENQPKVINAIHNLFRNNDDSDCFFSFACPDAYQKHHKKIDLYNDNTDETKRPPPSLSSSSLSTATTNTTSSISSTTTTNNNDHHEDNSNDSHLQDIEDLDFYKVHNDACSRGEVFYKDPETGYSVFTEVAHKQRGKCCGSGCRHCPYDHQNVRDKAVYIKQPAFMHFGDNDDDSSDNIFSIRNTATATFNNDNNNKLHEVRVLFFSGGKDSTLTIRALARENQKLMKQNPNNRFSLVLLTTFDATTRIIVSQEIPISVVVKQAKHLGISLIGCPMHNGSSESYVHRVGRAVNLIQRKYSNVKVTTLAFGDLHLESIYQWRVKQLSKLNYKLQFPLWKASYKLLAKDLEDSGIRCVVSSTNVDIVTKGELYDSNMRTRLFDANNKRNNNINYRSDGDHRDNNANTNGGIGSNTDKTLFDKVDIFGECGEFHTCAEVWSADRARALGIINT